MQRLATCEFLPKKIGKLPCSRITGNLKFHFSRNVNQELRENLS